MCKAWEGFTAGAWQSRIDVRDFIQKNYTPYGGDEAFLAPATPRTQALMHKLQGLMKLEQEFGGVLDVDTQTVSSLLNYKPGYLDKDNELIVGLQTDRPLKRGVNPFGGIRMAREACRAYGYELSGQVEQEFAYRTTHNDGVFRVYNEQTRAARHCGLITGLPDAYGRGRIIGDYRRVALYGTDRLIEEKKKDKVELGRGAMTDENIRLIEEVWRQIDFLGKLRDMAALYGCDISRPAQSAREAVQWTYFGYLGAIKEQNGAAMSLGRVSTFLDIYFERDLAAGRLDEAALDALCARVLRLALAHAPQRKKAYPAPVHHVAAVRRMLDRHHALAVRAARESAVLLKNEGRVLPLAPDAKVAVVGALAGRRCRYQGAGSSLINAHGRPDFLHALVRGGCRDAAYAPGYDPDSECVDAKLEEKALNAARGADTVLLFLGLTDLFETEGYDRAHMRLPFNQLHLLDRLAGAGKDVVVVLAGGSPVETPWLPRAKAVLYTALGGEGVGEAVFQLLYGRACPAGRLAETWPKRLEDTPAARHWPMGPDAVTYNESIYVGYRYYDKAHVDVRFPFGYGLSYTSFAYSGLTLSRKVLAPGKAIEVLFTVENTGAMAGVETAQVYVAHRNSAAHQPVRTLAGFARVALKPGERKTVCVTLPPSALEFYDVARHAFVVEAGRYEVSVGRHSRCLLLHAAFTARGETVALPPAHSAGGPYGSFADNTFPDAAFAAIHTRPLPRNQKPVRGEYTQTTVLGDMLDSRTGRALHALALCAARLGMHFSNNPAVNRRVCEMTVRDLPFKNLVLNTSGIIRYPAAEALLALANGRLFSRGGTVRAERGRSRKG